MAVGGSAHRGIERPSQYRHKSARFIPSHVSVTDTCISGPSNIVGGRPVRASNPEHLFAIGEIVSLNSNDGQMTAKLNPFTIEARLPPVGTLLQYRIKSLAEDCRRVVAEHQLTPFEAEATARPALLEFPKLE